MSCNSDISRHSIFFSIVRIEDCRYPIPINRLMQAFLAECHIHDIAHFPCQHLGAEQVNDGHQVHHAAGELYLLPPQTGMDTSCAVSLSPALTFTTPRIPKRFMILRILFSVASLYPSAWSCLAIFWYPVAGWAVHQSRTVSTKASSSSQDCIWSLWWSHQ